MKKDKMESVFDMVRNLPEDERRLMAERIMEMLSDGQAFEPGRCQELVLEHRPERPDCPHCKARADLGYIVKRGKSKGAQRFFCKSCGTYFVPSTNTVFERSRKDADTWRKFIELTIEGKSLHVCAYECEIAYQTAFNWRHKILNAFKVNQDSVQMNGRVEMDEMLVPISYKGNRVKGNIGTRRLRAAGEDNGLNRKSYKRGTDNKSNSSKDKACVFCMVENGNKAFYGAVPGVGYMLPSMLNKTVAKHVNKESAIVLVDQYKVTANYLSENNYKFITLLSNTSDNPHDHKPQIEGNLHLQHVNAMHHHIRNFLRPYCGVSTKYLENYISLYVWIKTNQENRSRKRIENASIARAATADCYISRREIEGLPAVPNCA